MNESLPGEIGFLPTNLNSIQICALSPDLCGCFIVRNAALLLEDRDSLFKAEDRVEIVEEGSDILDLLVKMGIFPSRGQARKNWRGPVEIPGGWTEAATSKGRNRRFLFIWNPQERK